MTDGGMDRRDQLIMWAMGEASLLRRQEQRGRLSTADPESPWAASATERAEPVLRGDAADCGSLVVDWQLPGGPGPDTAA